MIDELLPWYQKELHFLKQEAVRFARRYPQLAGRLDLQEHDTENLDPHAERLIQAVAILAARVRAKIEDRFPELSDTLLELMFPHYLAPFPSSTIAQFQVDPEQGRITTKHPIPRGTTLHSRPVDGVNCRYRTCFDVEVWPLEIEQAAVESPARPLPRRGPSTGIVSALRFTLRSPTEVQIAEMGLDRLRLHLDGEPAVCHGLYEMLLRHAVHVELTGRSVDGEERVVPLRASSIRPVGFGDDEGLLIYPHNSFVGFRLLQELFTLPEKFLFVDLAGLEATAEAGFGESMEVHVFCNVPPRFQQHVEPSNLRLNCTPAVNLFERTAEPINLDLRKSEYPVVADARSRKATEVWMIRQVAAHEVDGRPSAGIVPLFSFGHGAAVEGTQCTWQQRREAGVDGAGEVFLGIGLPQRKTRDPLPEVLTVRILCTNRNLPESLQMGGDDRGDFFLDPAPGFLKVFGLRQPTRPLRTPVGREAHWRLVSHLALNQVSILSEEGAALRGLLELYEPTNSRAVRQQIAAIQEVHSRRTDRFLDGSLLRGLEVEIVLDETAFTGTGHYLFASVLDRFLGMYAAVNSFVQLTVVSRGDAEDRIVFPPRAGQQVIL